MKKFSKRLFTSLVAFCMLFSVSAVPAFAAETTTEITDTQQPVVIGEYDGYLTDVMISDGHLIYICISIGIRMIAIPHFPNSIRLLGDQIHQIRLCHCTPSGS